MIPHDAFLVLCALIELGGKATREILTDAVDNSVDKSRMDEFLKALLEASLIEVSLRVSYRDFQRSSKQVSLRNSQSFLEAFNNYKTIKSETLKASRSAKDAKRRAVDNLLDGAVKMSNSNYRAVVDGTRARLSPVQQFAERCMSRQDLPAYWKRIARMTPIERELFSASVTRMVTGGG